MTLCYVHKREPSVVKAVQSQRTVKCNATQITHLGTLITSLHTTPFAKPYSNTPFVSPRLIRPPSAGKKMVGRHRCDATNGKPDGWEAPRLLKSYAHLNIPHHSPALAVALNQVAPFSHRPFSCTNHVLLQSTKLSV